MSDAKLPLERLSERDRARVAFVIHQPLEFDITGVPMPFDRRPGGPYGPRAIEEHAYTVGVLVDRFLALEAAYEKAVREVLAWRTDKMDSWFCPTKQCQVNDSDPLFRAMRAKIEGSQP